MTTNKQRVVRGGRSEAEKAVMRGRNLLIKAGYGDYWKHVLANGAPQIDGTAMRSPYYCVLGRTFYENTNMESGFDYGLRELKTLVPSARDNGDDEIASVYYGFASEQIDGYDALADAWVAQALRDRAKVDKVAR